jgi:hypothetical protein
MRGQVRAHEREIRMLQRAGMLAAAAGLQLVRMRAKLDGLTKGRTGLSRFEQGVTSAETCTEASSPDPAIRAKSRA